MRKLDGRNYSWEKHKSDVSVAVDLTSNDVRANIRMSVKDNRFILAKQNIDPLK